LHGFYIWKLCQVICMNFTFGNYVK